MKKQFFSAVMAVLFGLFLAGQVLAIGMVTEPIVLKDVLRGQQLIVSLTLLGSKNTTEVYEFSGEGAIANWVKFYEESDVNLQNPITFINVLPSYFNVLAVFTVPKDVPNGKYEGNLMVLGGASHASSTETQTTVRQAVSRRVKIEITDKETIKLNSQIIPLAYQVNQGEPLQIKVIYENQGNVELKPKTNLQVLKQDQVVFEAQFPYPSKELAVKPLERKVFDPLLTWQTQGQATGSYLIKVKVLLGEEIIQEEEFNLNVLAFSERIMAFVAKIGFGSVGLGWFLIGFLFILIAFNLAIISKKPKLFEKIFKLKSRLIKENNN